jgi:hypothetical protein
MGIVVGYEGLFISTGRVGAPCLAVDKKAALFVKCPRSKLDIHLNLECIRIQGNIWRGFVQLE